MAIQFTAGAPTKAPEMFVKAGDYKLRIIEASQDSSTKGNDMIKLKLRVLLPDGSEGPSLFDYLVFSENSFWKVDAFLKSCDKHPGEGEKIDIEPEELIGLECEATLKVEKYQGNKNNKVAAYLFEEF